MAEHDSDTHEGEIETEEGTAGGPQTHDAQGTRLRAETPGMLTPEELDERQERIGTERKRGGPDLNEDAASPDPDADEDAPDVPPTETEEPAEGSP
jgi:hypothetical protein